MVRVRFAPSPTGIPHIGNTRTAFFNYLFSKHEKGEFILRIEDTDQKRIVKEALDAIYEIFNFLGIKNDGDVIHQSERLDIYKKYANELIDKKVAYEKDGAIWISIDQKRDYSWTDGVGKKEITFKGDSQEDFVILKSDSFPTYHLANVVDDHLMEITHVIRGEEWISSTPKHIFLYESLGWNAPVFSHLPVILGTDKTKLSKRHGAKSVLEYRDEGYLKEALLNYMALLGWNPGGDKEKFSIDEMTQLFQLKDVNTSNPIFDVKKLEWLNGLWIREMSDEELRERLIEYYKDDKEVINQLKGDNSLILISNSKSRMKKLSDFSDLVSEKERKREMTKEEKEIALKLLEHLDKNLGDNWENDKLLDTLRSFQKEGLADFKTIYFLMTGQESGIGILELNQIKGKEFFIDNLKK